MRNIALLGCLILALSGHAQETFEYTAGDTTFVMQKYFMSLLMSGSERSENEEEAAILQQAHLDHMDALGQEGIIVIAGPFEGGEEYLGVVIYATKTLEEARMYQEQDTLVQRGILEYKLIPWWAAKGSKLP